MDQDKLKHLEFIQNVITRMNTNSFQIKNWTVTIIAALLAVYASTKEVIFINVTLVPIVVFWFLDAYYLTQERKFRGLYNDVAGISETPKNIKPFEMRPDLYEGEKYNYWNVMKSPTILKMYLSLLVLMVGIYFIEGA